MVVMLLFAFSGRSFAALGNYADLDAKSRNALDVMVKEIRQAKSVSAYQPNMLVFTNFNNQVVQYVWDSTTNTLTRSVDGVLDPRPLLTGCRQLNFAIYQRSPSNSYEFFDTASNVSVCKLVDISWLCSRTVLGKINSESVQTTKIVIRNEKVQN